MFLKVQDSLETIKNMLRFRNKIILVNTKVRFFTKNYSLSLIYLFPVTFVSILSSFTLWILCLSPLLLSVLCMYVRLNQTLFSASMDFPSSKSPSHLQFLFVFLFLASSSPLHVVWMTLPTLRMPLV